MLWPRATEPKSTSEYRRGPSRAHQTSPAATIAVWNGSGTDAGTFTVPGAAELTSGILPAARNGYAADAANMAFSRRSHSSSSTISKRIPTWLIAGTNSAQSALRACSEQMSNTDRL